ncbi:hypothetical protein EDB89DRAFT_1843075, partial [Lactarius sanguifluus]
VDTTVFGFSPDNLSDVDSVAKRALITSSAAAAIRLFVDVWFMLAYSGADVHKFRVCPFSSGACRANSDRTQSLAVNFYVAFFVTVLALVTHCTPCYLASRLPRLLVYHLVTTRRTIPYPPATCRPRP